MCIRDRMKYRIKRSAVPVFVPADFKDLSGNDQIGRVFRRMTKSGFLIKIGQGVYARSRISPITGKPTLERPIQELAKAALVKRGVKITQSRYEKAYNEGKTTQVPTGRVIGVKGRVSRKIGYNGSFVTYEQYA
eukprot:TRINITY_DN3809_c0_g1_i1.p1 TRINITY_DN3809_c0_g1~~TRINITY_DN3809_c0_g1_i1.p1  ORF type:complete len:134 (-),score=11.32 TRINITY_DN3809_c0_g1_i1:333-734(-)